MPFVERSLIVLERWWGTGSQGSSGASHSATPSVQLLKLVLGGNIKRASPGPEARARRSAAKRVDNKRVGTRRGGVRRWHRCIAGRAGQALSPERVGRKGGRKRGLWLGRAVAQVAPVSRPAWGRLLPPVKTGLLSGQAVRESLEGGGLGLSWGFVGGGGGGGGGSALGRPPPRKGVA